MNSLTRGSFFYILILLLALCPLAHSADTRSDDLLQRANTTYSMGNYPEAIELFQDLLDQGGISANLLYNLGNSYAQNGQTGKAIVQYKRALLLSPADSDIRGNLELIRNNAGLFQEETPWHEKLLYSLGLNQWAAVTLISLIILSTIQLTALYLPLGRQLRLLSSGVLVLIACLAALATHSHHRQWHQGVVVNPDVRLQLSPFGSSSSSGLIQEGRLVLPEKQHGAYYLVRDETGRTGWLPTESLEFVTSPPQFTQ